MAIIKPKRQDNTDINGEDAITNPSLNILHMYPQEMNIYGDMGNVICLSKRSQWRAIETHTYQLHLGGKITDNKGVPIDNKTISDFDLYFMGGGQDTDQADIHKDLLQYQQQITKLVEDNKVFLLICGGYQLFGKSFLTVDGERLNGLSILDIDTIGGKVRCVGNIIVESSIPGLEGIKLVGFENHSGRTKILSDKIKTFGKVLYGIGNAEKGLEEGGYYKNVFGCYIHGSFLPKNPDFADMLIKKALDTKYGTNKTSIVEIDDYIERIARDKIIRKYIKSI